MSRGTGERGATAVEFALVLPVLLLLVSGLLDLVGYLHTRGIVAEAARAGARAASVSADPDALEAEALSVATARLAALGQGARTPALSLSRDTTSGDVLEVELQVDYAPLVGLLPSPATITARASAVYEDPDG